MVRGKIAVRCFCSSPVNIETAKAATSATIAPGTRNFIRLGIVISPDLRNGRHVLDIGVEPRAGAESVGEDRVERRHQPQAVVEVVLVLQQHVDDVLEVAEGGLEVSSA